MFWNRHRDRDAALASDAPLRPAPGVLATSAGEDTVLLHLDRGQYYTLNAVGGRVWALLGEGCTVPEIIRRLAAEYDAPAEVIAADVAALLERMTRSALVERVD
ncbi:MAG TPA: PqqD family protein [Gemmatimonadaceae bacterium]|nr:PqqD family protein [Gemmatimonadaceae bacterium]